MRIPLTIAIGLTILAISVGVSLTRSPLVRAGTDGTPMPGEIGATATISTICQPEETVPQGTTAIQVSMLSLLGPGLKLRATAGGQTVTTGELGYGWTGSVVTIPVRRVAHTYLHARVCVTLARRRQLVNLRGVNTKVAPAVIDGNHVQAGRMRFDYLRPEGRSWFSLARPTARRIGLNIGGGGGIVAVPLLLLLTAAALTLRLLLRDLR